MAFSFVEHVKTGALQKAFEAGVREACAQNAALGIKPTPHIPRGQVIYGHDGSVTRIPAAPVRELVAGPVR